MVLASNAPNTADNQLQKHDSVAHSIHSLVRLCVVLQSVAYRLSQGVSSQQGAAEKDSDGQQDTPGMVEEVGPHVAHFSIDVLSYCTLCKPCKCVLLADAAGLQPEHAYNAASRVYDFDTCMHLLRELDVGSIFCRIHRILFLR